MPRVARRALIGVALLGAVTLLVTSGIAQRGEDPRNSSAEFFDAVNGANCINHHEREGLRPMAFSIVTRYSQLPIGEVVELELQIRHNSDLTQDLQDMAIRVDSSRARHIQVITDDFIPDAGRTFEETIDAGGSYVEAIPVFSGAVAFNASVAPAGDPSPTAGLGNVRLVIAGADGSEYAGEGDALSKQVSIGEEDLASSGEGDYELRVFYDHDAAPLAGSEDFRIEFSVEYAQADTTFRFEPVDRQVIRGADPGNQKTATFVIPVMATGAGEGVLDFRAEAINYWQHNLGDGAPSDEGLFYRFTTMSVSGGDTAIRVSGSEVAFPTVPSVDLFNMFARILGYLTLVLVPVAMVTGGMFGKGSRRWLNRVTGGAKKRVLWHNAMSFIIIGVATFHFLLALIEGKFVWTKGLFWGGVGWAVLVSLGFTGWYQVRMIKRWNYKVWRHTHLWSAVGVLVFGIFHSALDGSDLQFVRDALPGWHAKLIWP